MLYYSTQPWARLSACGGLPGRHASTRKARIPNEPAIAAAPPWGRPSFFVVCPISYLQYPCDSAPTECAKRICKRNLVPFPNTTQSQPSRNRLRLGVMLHNLFTHLAPPAGLLISAEGPRRIAIVMV